MNKQIKITELEAELLVKIAFDEFQPTNGTEPREFGDTSSIWSCMVIETKQERGVAMSLVEKGLIGISKYQYNKLDRRNETTLWFTEAGFAEFRKIQDAKVKAVEVEQEKKTLKLSGNMKVVEMEKAVTVYNVSYFDSLGGGSGLVRVEASILPQWLKERPGFLIRAID